VNSLLGDKRRLEAEVVRLKAENSRLRSDAASGIPSQSKLTSLERENKELRGKLEELQHRNSELSKLVDRPALGPITGRLSGKDGTSPVFPGFEDAGANFSRRSPAELPAISVPRHLSGHGMHAAPPLRDVHAITSGNFHKSFTSAHLPSHVNVMPGPRQNLPSISPEDSPSALPSVGSWLPAVPQSVRPKTGSATEDVKAFRSSALNPIRDPIAPIRDPLKELEDLQVVQGSSKGFRGRSGRTRRRSRGRASSRPSRPCSPSIAAERHGPERHGPGLPAPAPAPPSPRRMVPLGRAPRPHSRVDT